MSYKRKNAIRLRSIILYGIHGNLTVSKAAEILKINRTNLSRVLTGKAELSIELAKKIEYFFRYDGLALLQMQLADKYEEQKDSKEGE